MKIEDHSKVKDDGPFPVIPTKQMLIGYIIEYIYNYYGIFIDWNDNINYNINDYYEKLKKYIEDHK